MCAILLGLLLCLGYSQAYDLARCSNGSETKMTFTPYNDGLKSRYLVDWCINVNPKAPLPTEWTVLLHYFPSNTYCEHPPNQTIYHNPKAHSSYINQPIEFEGNCSHVCLNTTLDLVFNACYVVTTYFVIDTHQRNTTEYFIHIDNEFTKEKLKKTHALVTEHQPDGENVTLVYNTGLPFQDYNFELFIINKDHDLESVKDAKTDCIDLSPVEVKCHMRLQPGQYHTQLNLHAPWTHGVFQNQGIITYYFNVTTPLLPTVEVAPAWPWALGAFVTVVVLGAMMCWACHSKNARAFRKKVLGDWLMQRNESNTVPVTVPPKRHILLLYARECSLAANFCAALRDMLKEAPDTHVYDIFSPEVMSMAASGPHSWIRGMLQRSDVAVLLLQTPAMAALYQQQLNDNNNTVRLQEPLLGRRVLYRAPQYGDTLLQYAVQLIAESAHARNNYLKYYVATLSDLPTEMFPQLVPFRRYLLPGGAELLSRAICDVTPSPQSLDTLNTTAREFADLARDNADYLMDELMFLS